MRPCGGTKGVFSSSTPSTSAGIKSPCQCTSSGTSVSLSTSTTTGLPSFMRRMGPGEVPLYPMVLMMRVGVSSTVTGAIRKVMSALEVSCAPAAGGIPGMPGWDWDISSFAAPNSIAARPPSFMNFLRFTAPSTRGSRNAAPGPCAGVRWRNPLTVGWAVQGRVAT